MSSLRFRSLVYFELIFVFGVKEGSNSIFLHVAVSIPAPFVDWVACFGAIKHHELLVESRD